VAEQLRREVAAEFAEWTQRTPPTVVVKSEVQDLYDRCPPDTQFFVLWLLRRDARPA
jgi:hypothetical protein